MRHTLQQVFHSGKFVVGFSIFSAMLLLVLIYPLSVRNAPLEIIARGTFFPPGIYINTYDAVNAPTKYTPKQGTYFPPGIYISTYDAVNAPTKYTLNLDNASDKRIAGILGNQERTDIKDWLVANGIPENQINTTDTKSLIELWTNNYDPSKNVPVVTNAKQDYYARLNNSLKNTQSTEGLILASKNSSTGALEQTGVVNQTDYVNLSEIANVRVLLLGTNNFSPGDASEKRIAEKLGNQERTDMKDWLVADGIPASQIDTTDTKSLMELWINNYDPTKNIPGMTNAKRNYYARLNNSLKNILSTESLILAATSSSTGTLGQTGVVNQTDYVSLNDIANVRMLLLGTDNFGRDVLTELVKAIAVSLEIGLTAGIVATLIGLILGLLSGYIGGSMDDVLMFITNIFTVIPGLVLAILISFSIGQDKRGPATVAFVIGFTSWVWTARAVRSQVISLRNRDHVNLSKLSGHSITHIITFDILPYIASYVVMALILQISSGILTEAGLSILGLGPRTTEVPTLGLMMQWAMIYQAQILGKWWAYMPVIVAIALVAFSMNLMNTGLDQVFNPALRD